MPTLGAKDAPKLGHPMFFPPHPIYRKFYVWP
jgi:hypothetical protein